MPHIDPERLALFAMGEPGAAPDESEHLAECAVCVDDLAALRHAAVAGRATMEIGQLETPPEAVWQRISAELALTVGGSVPRPDSRASARALVAEPVSDRPPAERKSVFRRAWVLAASIVLVAALGLSAWAVGQRVTQVSEVAEATLAPFPAHPDAEGSAIVEELPDGSLALRVNLAADDANDGFREVWLITADASALVSLGVLEGREQTFAIPANVDLRDYVLVDVSQEPADGVPEHSGDSIVRGELTFL